MQMGVCDPSTGDQGNNGGIMPKQTDGFISGDELDLI